MDTKVICQVITILFSFSLVSQVVGATFENDVTLTLEQKKVLDQVFLIREAQQFLYSYKKMTFKFQFRNDLVGKLPHAYMETEMYLIKWLRSQLNYLFMPLLDTYFTKFIILFQPVISRLIPPGKDYPRFLILKKYFNFGTVFCLTYVNNFIRI